MASDEDYRKNRIDAQKRWAAKKKGYWKQYRASNPEYEKRNREKQKERERCKRPKKGLKPDASISGDLAKIDASESGKAVITGTYRLVPMFGDRFAKSGLHSNRGCNGIYCAQD